MFKELFTEDDSKLISELLKMDKEDIKKLKYYFKVVWKVSGSLKDNLNDLDNNELSNVYQDFIKNKDK